jgi:hypothetical protein
MDDPLDETPTAIASIAAPTAGTDAPARPAGPSVPEDHPPPAEDLAYAYELLREKQVVPPSPGSGSWYDQALRFSANIKPQRPMLKRPTITAGHQTRRLVQALKYAHAHPLSPED